MKNENFEIVLNPQNGTIKCITVPYDDAKMNWCLDDASWGQVRYESDMSSPWRRRVKSILELVSFEETEANSQGIYENQDIRVIVSRSFSKNGNLCERYVVKNLRDDELFLEHGALGIELPFNEESQDTENIKDVRKILESDHFGLEKVKERIIEYLSVLKESR